MHTYTVTGIINGSRILLSEKVEARNPIQAIKDSSLYMAHAEILSVTLAHTIKLIIL